MDGKFVGLFMLLLAALFFFVRLIDLVITNRGMDGEDDDHNDEEYY